MLSLALLALAFRLAAGQPYPDRFVWVFGWSLSKDSDVAAISRLLETAHDHGFNGAVVSFGLDTLSTKPPDYLRRLDEVLRVCEQTHLEVIPAVFSVGHGGGLLSQNPNLAEGLPVEDAPFLVRGGEARFAPTNAAQLLNGGFEDYQSNTLKNFKFQDQPGEVSFIDTEIRHNGRAALRLENFTANPSGHGRVMQEVKVQPHRCYRLTIWVKTQDLQPSTAFRLLVRAGDRDVAPRQFKLPSSPDWRKLTMLFNSLSYDKVMLYAGLWGGKSGKIWLDDWNLEEVGPVNVLHRPGTPVTIRSEDGQSTYVEGTDYAPLQDPHLSPWHDDGEALPLKVLPHSRIHDGDHLRVSWYHSMLINDSQVTVCMAEPALYELMDREAKVLAERVHPRRVMLNMDEVRMGGTCQACRGRNMGELLGECVTREATILRRYIPKAQIYLWSDMLDPNHNAHGNYFFVDGDFTGAWEHVPKDLVMAVWGGEPRETSLRFFSQQGFQTLVACYYDADNLDDVKRWLAVARDIHGGVRGFMYTPWLQKYSLLPAFGDLVSGHF